MPTAAALEIAAAYPEMAKLGYSATLGDSVDDATARERWRAIAVDPRLVQSALVPLGAPVRWPAMDMETAAAGQEHLDPAYVAGYDRKANVDPTDDLDNLRARGLDASSTVIDFGAGTGTFAVAAAAVCARVIAIDVSPAMVDALRAKVAEHGVTNVECVLGGFLTYEHEGPAVDVVYTRNALHHLPDFWKGIALSRIGDLLRPGGILRLRDLVFSFDLPEARERVAEWIETAAAGRPEDGWTRDELETHVRDEYSTYSWLLEPMLERAGFEIADVEYGPLGAYAAYVCVRR